MADYISREAAIEALRAYKCGETDFDDCIDFAISVVSVIPAADVRPVVHAEWEQVTGKYDKLFRCSKCRFVPIAPHYFCPNCGANMKSAVALEEAAQYADCGAMAPAT